jgi:hypothetical protein
MFQSTGDPNFNTTPPTGALADSGWQYQGQWGNFLGTPIASQYFVAAKHVGGSIGQEFIFDGVIYHTTAVFDDPNSDLRIWKVDGLFPRYAPLYTGSNELGGDMVMFGRGSQRGEQITSTVLSTNYVSATVDVRTLGLTSKQAKQLYPDANFKGNRMTTVTACLVTNTMLNGWQWGTSDGVTRWGTQKATSAYDCFLIATFSPSSSPTACHLSGGDSSGADFIIDGAGL